MSDGYTYAVLSGPKKDPAKLAAKVSMAMADGWWVQGGIQASGQLLYQAITKRPVREDRIVAAESGGWVEPA